VGAVAGLVRSSTKPASLVIGLAVTFGSTVVGVRMLGVLPLGPKVKASRMAPRESPGARMDRMPVARKKMISEGANAKRAH
jgi:hypothetical protein